CGPAPEDVPHPREWPPKRARPTLGRRCWRRRHVSQTPKRKSRETKRTLSWLTREECLFRNNLKNDTGATSYHGGNSHIYNQKNACPPIHLGRNRRFFGAEC